MEVEGSPLGEKKGFSGSGKETRGGVIGACYDQNTLSKYIVYMFKTVKECIQAFKIYQMTPDVNI